MVSLKCQPVCSGFYVDSLVRDCSNSIANALELLQSYTKPPLPHPLPPDMLILGWLMMYVFITTDMVQ